MQSAGQAPPNKGRKFPGEPLTDAEMRMILRACSQRAPTGIRNRALLTVMYRAGVPILAGTDANDLPGPAAVPHGSSLHHELELLVDAGLTTVDALRAATTRPARYFGLADRGVVEPGRRADLVLVDGDPLHDIKATQAIRRVWCAGTEVIPG